MRRSAETLSYAAGRVIDRPERYPTKFLVTPNSAGFPTLQFVDTGERMHPLMNPIREAELLYVEQSQLASLLQEGDAPLELWDVGLGMGANAIAAVRCMRLLRTHKALARTLHITSFENDLQSLEICFQRPQEFPFVQEQAVLALLKSRTWKEEGLNWRILEGDFRQTLEAAPPPEVIFFDPFGSRTSPELWTQDLFNRVFARCQSKRCVLVTYANARSVRQKMSQAGFQVFPGSPIGHRNQTTLARHCPKGDAGVN